MELLTVRKHSVNVGRLEWSHGLRAAAAGCRRQQGCQGQGACVCVIGRTVISSFISVQTRHHG